MSFHLFRSAAANEVASGLSLGTPGIGVALFGANLDNDVKIVTLIYMAVMTIIAIAKYYRKDK